MAASDRGTFRVSPGYPSPQGPPAKGASSQGDLLRTELGGGSRAWPFLPRARLR